MRAKQDSMPDKKTYSLPQRRYLREQPLMPQIRDSHLRCLPPALAEPMSSKLITAMKTAPVQRLKN